MNDKEFERTAYEKGCIVKDLKDTIRALNEIRINEKKKGEWVWMITEETPTKLIIEIRRI